MPESQPPSVLGDLHELVRELEKYRQIVECAGEAVVTTDSDGQVVYMNAAAEEMFGYPRREVLGRDIGPLLPDQYRSLHQQFSKSLAKGASRQRTSHTAEVRGMRKNGRSFPLAINFSLAETGEGPLLTMLMRDLSEERALAEQVRQAEKLAAVGEMVATVGHEIRSPLVLIGGFARQILGDPGIGLNSGKKASIIIAEVARLEGLLNELGDLSRQQRYRFQPTDLCDLVSHVREVMAPQLEDVRVEYRCHPDAPMVSADGDKLSQVLINLMNNAIQASGLHPWLGLEIGADCRGDAILVIRDHGQGMDPDQLDQCLTPFFTTKSKGTGLGLPVAKRIIDDHGGRLEICSQRGQGTTVTVRLPALGLGTSPANPKQTGAI